MNLQHYLDGRLNGVDTYQVDQIVGLLKRLHLLMVNLEVVLKLRRETQFSGRLLQLIQKYCHSSVDNQLIVDELSVQIFNVLSSLSIRGGWREEADQTVTLLLAYN
uniref:Uncharacterized protein n=1 Tax=Ditylenchus dipsaci TaxID=166011 RepID=A0A915E5K3_9BILA